MDLLFLLLPLFWGESFSQEHPGYNISVQERVTVQVGLCVSIPCSFQYAQEYTSNNIVYGYWFKGMGNNTLVATNDPRRTVQPRAQGRFRLIGYLQKDNCSLSITGVQKQDHGNYWFQVEKGDLRHSYLYKNVSVHVEDLTQKPEISIPDILESGHQVTLTCIAPGNCREGTPPNILWTGSALSSQAFVSQDLNSSQLLFTPKAQDHGTNITCQVKFPEATVTTEITVQLRVVGRPRVLGPSCLWTEEGLRCTCSVQGDLDPPSLHWWVGESIVHGNSSDNTLRVVHSTNSTWTNSSLILATKLDPDLGIRCEGRNRHGTHSASVLLLVPDYPRILGAFCLWAEKGSRCTCSVQGDLAPPYLHWWVGESIVHGNSSDNTLHVVYSTNSTWTNSSLVLAKRLDPGLGIRCEGRNRHGTHSASVLLLVPGKDSSSPWNFLTWMIKGALCGSIVTALLFTCLTVCLINTSKRKLSKRDLDTVPSETGIGHVSTVNPLAEAENSGGQGPLEHPPLPVLGSCSQEVEDQVHYASVSFRVQKPQEIPNLEDTHTQYSELKFQKRD